MAFEQTPGSFQQVMARVMLVVETVMLERFTNAQILVIWPCPYKRNEKTGLESDSDLFICLNKRVSKERHHSVIWFRKNIRDLVLEDKQFGLEIAIVIVQHRDNEDVTSGFSFEERHIHICAYPYIQTHTPCFT